MAWIESHEELSVHPKTKRLAGALGVSRVTAVGHLHFLWWWAMKFAQDGDLSRFEADEIAEAAGWEGEPEQFIRALIEAGGRKDEGFLGEDLSLHDWGDYAQRLIERRRANAERMRDARASRRAAHVPNTCAARAGATGPDLTGPNRTGPDLTGPESLKRPGITQPEGARDAPKAASPPAAAADTEVLDRLSALLAGQRGWSPTKAQLLKLAAVANERRLDLEAEGLKMLDWLGSPAGKRRLCTFRFVLNWLERSVPSGPRAQNTSRSPPAANGAARPALPSDADAYFVGPILRWKPELGLDRERGLAAFKAWRASGGQSSGVLNDLTWIDEFAAWQSGRSER